LLNYINTNFIRYINASIGWISRNRYSILVGFLFIRFAVFASNGFWSGDFWEHSAVVKEFIEHPAHPHHPLFLLDAPNAFMSPYALLVASFARLLGLNAIYALSIFGLFNYLLLTYGIKRFCSVISSIPSENTSFYFLLLTLMLWGNDPWAYSGFFHIGIIETVLPYPSTFSIGLSLIALSLFVKPLYLNKILSSGIICLIIYIILLSHPLTFIFLASGLFFLLFSSRSFLYIPLLNLTLVMFVACMTAFLWPYFSLYDLLFGGSNVYHSSNSVMYLQVWDRIWPNIMFLPFLWWTSKSRVGIVIVFWLVSLCVLYMYGSISLNYSYGRIISYCILLFQVLAAVGIAQFEMKIEMTCLVVCRLYRILLLSLLVALSGTWLPYVATRVLTIVNQLSKNNNFINQVTYKNLVFINKLVSPDQLVIADLETSWMIPTFSGRVIAALHPQAFVNDINERNNDVVAFFNIETKKQERIDIINKYRPQFLLLDLNKTTSSQIQSDLSQLIEPLYTNEQYRLFRFL